MAAIEWTEQRVRAFEEARAKGMNNYILDQGIRKGAPLYFVGMAILSGFMDGWRPSFFFVFLPFLAVLSLLFGYFFARWVWRKYDRSYREFLASKPPDV